MHASILVRQQQICFVFFLRYSVACIPESVRINPSTVMSFTKETQPPPQPT